MLLALNGFDYSAIGDPFRNGKIRYLLLLLVPAIFYFLKPRLTFGPAFFGALALFSWVVNDYKYYGVFPLAVILGTLACACVVRVYLSMEGVAWILVLSGLFQAVLGLLQLCGVYFFFEPLNAADRHVPVGLMGQHTVLGTFLAAALPAALWRGKWFSAFIMCVAILATSSSMAILTAGVVFLLYAWHRFSFRASAALVGLGSLAIGALYWVKPDHPFLSFTGRWFMWDIGWRAFLENPYFGAGIGGWVGEFLPRFKNEIIDKFVNHVPQQLHSDYLDFLVEYGALPALVMLYPFYRFLRYFRPTWPHAVCVAILVNAVANFPLCLVPTALVFTLCWAEANRV